VHVRRDFTWFVVFAATGCRGQVGAEAEGGEADPEVSAACWWQTMNGTVKTIEQHVVDYEICLSQIVCSWMSCSH